MPVLVKVEGTLFQRLLETSLGVAKTLFEVNECPHCQLCPSHGAATADTLADCDKFADDYQNVTMRPEDSIGLVRQ